MPKSMILGSGLPVLDRDQHVGRLEIAMNDALLVGVIHGLAGLDEEAQALLGREPLAIAVVGEGQAPHELHDEVGPSRLGGAGVEDAGDARVVHEGEGLALGLEAGHHFLRLHAQLDDLEGHPARHRLHLLGQVDDAHAALAQHLEEPVGADALQDLGGLAARGGLRLARPRWR